MKSLLTMILLSSQLMSGSSAGIGASHIVVDYHTGMIFLQKNADRKRPVASLTKMATAAVALDWIESAEVPKSIMLTVPRSASSLVPFGVGMSRNMQVHRAQAVDLNERDGNSRSQNPKVVETSGKLWLLPGDRINLSDALAAAIMASDNVAAMTIADNLGRDILSANGKNGDPLSEYIRNMNVLARRLLMTKTTFRNPHGLDHARSQRGLSTAEDMARLAIYVMSKPSYRFYSSQARRTISYERGGVTYNHVLVNTNKLVNSEEIDGVKTGMTSRAGGCLALSASRATTIVPQENGVNLLIPNRLVVVVLGDMQRFVTSKSLLDYGWRMYNDWHARGRPVKKATDILRLEEKEKKR